MGLVKTRRLAAMQKQQRAKAGMTPPVKKGGALPPHLYKSGGKPAADLPRREVRLAVIAAENSETALHSGYNRGIILP